MKSDLSKVKVGDRIWTIKKGWEKVERMLDSNAHPIATKNHTYSIDGKYNARDTHPSAFTFNPFEQQQPFGGYWAMVSGIPITEDNKGYKRFVLMEKNGKYIAWNGTVIASWNYAQRIPEPAAVPEYTVEELIGLIGYEFKIKK